MKNYMRTITAALIAAGVALSFAACNAQPAPPTANQQEAAQQAAQQAEGLAAVGPVKIVNWTQKRQFQAILEAFDQPNLITYSYLFSNYTGKLVPLCRSQGYGFNEATQYTNPLMSQWKEGSYGNGSSIASAVVSQPDPNGLYSPPSSPGTLLLCLTTSAKVLPVRSEPDVITLPVPYSELDRQGME
jgi:hypothetical protein